MNVLLVEDDQFKAKRLEQTIEKLVPGVAIQRANSVRSSTQALESGVRLNLVILDMSLPTFDVGPRESGGRPQGFGGREVMRFMLNNELHVPVIVVTQFERFGEADREIDLPTLAQSLKAEFPDLFRGMVYYDSTSERWRTDLTELLGKL